MSIFGGQSKNYFTEKLKTDFKNHEDCELVRNILADLDVKEKLRIVRCILFVSEDNLETFGEMEVLANTDYRDVIMAAEYEYPTDKRLRGFSQPFST